MQDEQTWMSQQTAEESAAKERYEYFTRPEPRDNMSEIYYEKDEYLGTAKCRDLRIGMVRNASDDNKKVVKAYLEPFPHLRIDSAKPLQGWYQSMINESKQSRPRPCFTEAILTEPYGGYCAVGCQFCVLSGEMIDTPHGQRPIESLLPGETVWGRSGTNRVEAFIRAISSHVSPSWVIVCLTDGRRLKVTNNHPMYSLSRGWMPADDLQPEEELENGRLEALPGLWGGDKEIQDCLRYLFDRSEATQRSSQRANSARQALETLAGYQRQDVCYGLGKPGEYVQEGKRSKIAGIQGVSGRSGETGQVGLSTVEKRSLYRPQESNFSHEITLGSADCQTLGPPRLRLGLRAVCDQDSERRLFTRLCIEIGNHYRSQRVSNQASESAIGRGSRPGAASSDFQPEESGTYRRAIVSKVVLQSEAALVHDIETDTGNFYLQGVLQKNCYINSGMRGYRGTGLISVPLNYGEQIKKQLTKMRRSAAGYFSSFTDPFTPLEQYYHNTQEAATEFVNVGLPIFFLSRLAYPQWAIELLTKNQHSYAQKSINTSDPEDWRHLSPGAIPLMEHLKEITHLKKRGIYVSIQVNPIVPGVTSNEQIVRLFHMLKEAGADHVIVKFVEAAYSWAPAMVERIKKVFGDERGGAFEALFTQNIGSERTVEEEYRMRAHKLFSSYARRIGLTYATCYEYRYERDEEGKILSKTGVSVGREFTTAEQCHGHRVPMYERHSAEEQFKPLEECPPSGCLYCAAENNGEPRCGDELAGQAKALKFVDLQKEFQRA